MGMEGDAIDRRGKLAFSSVFFYYLFCLLCEPTLENEKINGGY